MRPLRAGVVIIASLLALPGVAHAQLQLDEGFESGSLGGWSSSGNATASIVSSPVRAGTHAVRTPLGPTDVDPKRTEITAGNAGKLLYDQEYWIGFSVYLKRWDAPLPSWATLFQFHAVPGNEDWSNCVAGRNPFTVTNMAGQIGVSVIKQSYTGPPPVPGGAIANIVWQAPMQLNQWYDWVVRLKPSLTAGVLEVWLNDVKLYSQTGANVDAIDDCGVAQEPWTYLKIGVYKENTNTATEDVYFDEVRIYKGTQGYNVVRPGGPPLDGGVAADAKAADAKAADAKAADARAADARAADARPPDSGPFDVWSTEGPLDARPRDSGRADAHVSDATPADHSAVIDGRWEDASRALQAGCGCGVARSPVIGPGLGGCLLSAAMILAAVGAGRRRGLVRRPRHRGAPAADRPRPTGV